MTNACVFVRYACVWINVQNKSGNLLWIASNRSDEYGDITGYLNNHAVKSLTDYIGDSTSTSITNYYNMWFLL